MIGKEGIALRLVSLFIIWMGRTTLTWSLGMKLGTFVYGEMEVICKECQLMTVKVEIVSTHRNRSLEWNA